MVPRDFRRPGGGWWRGCAALALSVLGTGAAEAPKTPWKFEVGAGAKEEFDSNVYLQDVGSLRDRESLVTTLSAAASVKYTAPTWNATASYAPDLSLFHSESSEDHMVHRLGLSASGKPGLGEWDLQNQWTIIDGEEFGLVFTGPGGAPAAGGPKVRDRRDAAVYRGSVKYLVPVGDWLVRPVVTAYLHDFQTRHLSTPGYLNYVDRNEYAGGVDVGRTVSKGTRAFVGYRYGRQDQSKLMSYPEEYDNEFHRALAIVEGTPWSWAKLSVSLGPEFRHYGDKVHSTFERDRVVLFADVTGTFTVTTNDTVVATVKQFEQPGFGGRSAYLDSTYDLVWRHKFGPKWTASLMGRAYNTKFLDPVLRRDWVLSASAALTWKIDASLTSELSYTHEDGESELPATEGREYVRDVVALGVKYSFR